MNEPVRIAVVGAGAMGCLFGARLALAGHDVTLVEVRPEQADALRSRGVELLGEEGGPLSARPAVTTDPSGLEPFQLALVLTKSYATADAARLLRPATSPGTWVVTLQNGLGNDGRLAAVLGPERVVPGTTTVGAEQVRPGTVRMSSTTARRETTTYLGPPVGTEEAPEPVHAIARVLTGAGLPAEALDGAAEVIWTKLALAAPMGCLSALLRRTVIDTYEDESSRRLLRAMMDEVLAVGAACGVRLDPGAAWERCERTFSALGPHTASMAADVLGGRRTEVDALCLEVVRLGEQHGVPTPVSRTVGLALRAVEATYERALDA